jgi:hypothetical protein
VRIGRRKWPKYASVVSRVKGCDRCYNNRGVPEKDVVVKQDEAGCNREMGVHEEVVH